jgi:uncharacterized OsmC-like protein
MADTIFIKHHDGTRFSATFQDYTVFTGHGDPGTGPDSMTPGMLFASALGMCVGVTLLAYCKNHDIAYEGMEIEMVRENTEDGKRLKKVTLQVKLPAKLSQKDIEVLNRVAHRCYVGQSILNGAELEEVITITGK